MIGPKIQLKVCFRFVGQSRSWAMNLDVLRVLTGRLQRGLDA